jgi:hypothetical protein
VIGKIALIMHVAAAKINQSSIVPAFDHVRVAMAMEVMVAVQNGTHQVKLEE